MRIDDMKSNGWLRVMKVHRFRTENCAAKMVICVRDNNSEERNKS